MDMVTNSYEKYNPFWEYLDEKSKENAPRGRSRAARSI